MAAWLVDVQAAANPWSRRLLGLCIGLSLLAACEPADRPIPLPTSTLIPVTATFTPTPVLPTAPPPPVTAPEGLLPTPRAQPLQPLLGTSAELEPGFIAAMMQALAADLGITPDLIRLAQVEARVWITQDLGCSAEPALQAPILGYQVRLLVGTTLYPFHTNGTTTFTRCPTTTLVRGSLLVAADPIAAEMFNLAQRQLAQQLDLPARRIQLVDMFPVTWADTSLGCPQADTSYTPAALAGYRLVVAVGAERYAFHTDSERLYPCPAGREVLPDTAN